MHYRNLRKLFATLSIAVGLTSQIAHAQSASDITDLILVTGQSNVRGSQTAYDESQDAVDLRVFAYTDSNDWEVADLHQAWDVDGWHPGNGSLADSSRSPYNNFAFHFAKTIVENDPDRVVGLIIASAPGEGIKHWDANSSFSQIVESKVVAALNAQGVKSQIDGIIWHQGETDWQYSGTSDVDATDAERSDPTYYPTKLNALISRYRAENWFDSNKPFICGETRQAPVNDRLLELNSDNDPWTACVMGHDLPTREQDLQAEPPKLGTHFNAVGLRLLGQRYGMKYLELTATALKPATGNTSTCNGLTVTVDLSAGDSPTNGDDVIMGTDGSDTIFASAGNDTICGEGGDDTIAAGGGIDWVDGGNGNDHISGHAGNDILFGGEGNDVIFGGNGDDYIEGEAGDDTLAGHFGNDTIDGGNGIDGINGGGGDDTIYTGSGATVNSGVLVSGGGGSDAIYGGPDADFLLGAAGLDEIHGEGGDDVIVGGPGSDEINGGDGADDIQGNGSRDFINGDAGDDIISGGPGPDILDGGTGNDILRGDSDNDRLSGGIGNDTLIGGGSLSDVCDGDVGTDTAASCENVTNVP